MKRILFYIAASILCIGIFFGTVEVATRVVSLLAGRGFFLALHELDPLNARIKAVYQWHPFVGVMLTPNRSIASGHPRQRRRSIRFIDKHGFFAKDNGLTYQKPDDEIRIAAIGASTTACLNLNFEESWPGYLGILLQEALPDKTIRVINAAMSGYDTAQNIGNLSLRVMPFKPDVVIIYHGWNDLKAVVPGVDFKPDYSHLHLTPHGCYKEPNIFRKALGKSMLYVRVRNKFREYRMQQETKAELQGYTVANIKKGVYTTERASDIPPDALRAFKQHIQILVSIARVGGAEVILPSFVTLYDPHYDWSDPATFDGLSQRQRDNLRSVLHYVGGLTLGGIFDAVNKYNEILHTVALQEGIGWVDSVSLMPHEDKYFVDRIHFSAEGARRMAEILFPVVLERIESKIAQ